VSTAQQFLNCTERATYNCRCAFQRCSSFRWLSSVCLLSNCSQ